MADYNLSSHFWGALPRPIIGLSPMDGVTDPCFRRLMAIQGRPDLIMTEFLSVEGICHGAKQALYGLSFHESERPVIAQLYGPHPESFFHVAQLVCELGFDGLDINMGCPSKKVASLGSGAALIKDPARAKAIVKATKKGIERWVSGAPLSIFQVYPELVDGFRCHSARSLEKSVHIRKQIPVSIKTRIGVEKTVVRDWIHHILDVCPAAITIHGRTLRQGYRGEADWEAIAEAAEIARGTETLILGNGDLKSMNDVTRRVRQTGVDGVLIGRAAMGNPWIFHKKEVARGILKQTDRAEQLPPIHQKGAGLNERFSVALQHARLYEAMNGKQYFSGMRKHLGSYCREFDGARSLRSSMVRTHDSEEVADLMKTFIAETASVEPLPNVLLGA